MPTTKFADTVVDNENAYPRAGAVCTAAQRTATGTFGPTDTTGAGAVAVIVEVTSLNAGTPSITVQIQGVTVFGTAYTIFQSAAIATVSVVRLLVAPSLTGVTNLTANSVIPSKFQIQVTHADAQPITYQISVEFLTEG
jgi:hypothetical protein